MSDDEPNEPSSEDSEQAGQQLANDSDQPAGQSEEQPRRAIRQRSKRKNSLLTAMNRPSKQKNQQLPPIRLRSRRKNNPLRAIKQWINQAMPQEEAAAVAAEVEVDLEMADQRTMRSLPTVAVSRHAL